MYKSIAKAYKNVAFFSINEFENNLCKNLLHNYKSKRKVNGYQ